MWIQESIFLGIPFLQSSCTVGPSEQVLIQRCVLETQYTSPKEHLLEGDLVEALEKHGIGTDGAMAHHIQSLVDNKYCTVDTSGSNRHMVPTDLGRCFVKGFSMIDDTLVKPDLRAYTERYAHDWWWSACTARGSVWCLAC